MGPPCCAAMKLATPQAAYVTLLFSFSHFTLHFSLRRHYWPHACAAASFWRHRPLLLAQQLPPLAAFLYFAGTAQRQAPAYMKSCALEAPHVPTFKSL